MAKTKPSTNPDEIEIPDGMTEADVAPHVGPGIGIFVGGGRRVQGVDDGDVGPVGSCERRPAARRPRQLGASDQAVRDGRGGLV